MNRAGITAVMPGMSLRPVITSLSALALSAATAGVAAAATQSGSGTEVGTRHTSSLGTFLVKHRGERTVYLFEKDSRDRSRCFRACATVWPPLMTKGRPEAVDGAKASKLGRIKRGSGWQVTYAGHPLYLYSADGAGSTNGQGLNAFGAFWYVVNPRGGAVR